MYYIENAAATTTISLTNFWTQQIWSDNKCTHTHTQTQKKDRETTKNEKNNGKKVKWNCTQRAVNLHCCCDLIAEKCNGTEKMAVQRIHINILTAKRDLAGRITTSTTLKGSYVLCHILVPHNCRANKISATNEHNDTDNSS